MKITRKKLRQLIEEAVSYNETAEGRKIARSESLHHFYRLSNRLKNIYNSHRSWDQAPLEKKLSKMIDVERSKLMSVINPETGSGFLEDELNAIKNMNYEEFDLFMTYIDKD